MEWTLREVRKLLETQGLKASRASTHFAPKGHEGACDGTNFDCHVEGETRYEGFTLKDSRYNAPEGLFYLRLEGDVNVSVLVEKDDFHHYAEALGKLLQHPEWVAARKFGGAHNAGAQLREKLQDELAKVGKVTNRNGTLTLRGAGQLSPLASSDTQRTGYRVKLKDEQEDFSGDSDHWCNPLLDNHDEYVAKLVALVSGKGVEETDVPTTLGECFKGVTEWSVENFKYKYDCGDSRSYGSLSVEFDLPFGHVEVKNLAIGTAGDVESGWDEEVTVNGVVVEFDELPAVDVPHYCGGYKAVERFEANAAETLKSDFEDWLAEVEDAYTESLTS